MAGSVSQSHTLVVLLLSGGGGTRLWPLSTEQAPKQFLRLFDGQSLFQKTVLRAVKAGVTHVHVLANKGQSHLLHHDWREIADQVGSPHFVLEPMRRDSGPAIAAGIAECLALYGPQCQVLVLPCDHLIPDDIAFAEAVAWASDTARKDYLVTFGLKPQAPVTDYGYIKAGETLAGLSARHVAAFVEKPDRATAQHYIDEGNYYWNSGMFLFSAGVFAREAELNMPDLWRCAQSAVEKGRATDQGFLLDEDEFSRAQAISIDYALFEKSTHVAVVPVDIDWSDVGGWAAMHDALRQGDQGMALSGPVIAQDSQNSLVLSDGLPILTLGLQDMVVVATKAGVFVAPKDRTSEIKTLLARLPEITIPKP